MNSAVVRMKEGLVFRVKFLVTWGGAYAVKNVIITLHTRDSSFLITGQLHGIVYKSLSWELSLHTVHR